MKTVNLHELYPDAYHTDHFVEVPDKIADEFVKFGKADAAYRSCIRYHKAYYSLDRNDGIENEAVEHPATPHEVCERKMLTEQLYDAIASLPDTQAKRVDAHYFMEKTLSAIAEDEGVSVAAVSKAINHALGNMKIFLSDWQ